MVTFEGPPWIILSHYLAFEIDALAITVYTSSPVTLTVLITDKPPTEKPIYKLQRGERVFCYTLRRLIGYRQIRQYEYDDSTKHTFLITGINKYKTYWYRFRGTIIAIKSISSSPIFKTTLGWYWEPWDGAALTTNHPWIKSMSPGSIARPENGHLLLQAPYRDLGYGGTIRTSTRSTIRPYPYPKLPHYMYVINSLVQGAPIMFCDIQLVAYSGSQAVILDFLIYTYAIIAYPHYQISDAFFFIGWGSVQVDLWAAMQGWCTWRGVPWDPGHSRIMHVQIQLWGGWGPHPPFIAYTQEFLDLSDELVLNKPLTPIT